MIFSLSNKSSIELYDVGLAFLTGFSVINLYDDIVSSSMFFGLAPSWNKNQLVEV